MRYCLLSSVYFSLAACGTTADAGRDDAGAMSADAGFDSTSAPDSAPLGMGGTTFESLTAPRGGRFFGVAAGPGVALVSAYGRHLRSDDGGATWVSLGHSGLSGCGREWLLAAGDYFFAGCGDGSFASGDDGESWFRVEAVVGVPVTDGTDVYWTHDEGTVARWNARARVAAPIPGMRVPLFAGPPLTAVDGSILFRVGSRGSGWLDLATPAPVWTPLSRSGTVFTFGEGEVYGVSLGTMSRHMPDHSFVPVGTFDFTLIEGRAGLVHGGRFVVATYDGLQGSSDGGVTWSSELPVHFESGSPLAAQGSRLFAASQDGLWVRRGDAPWQEIELHSHRVYRSLAIGDALLVVGEHGPKVRLHAGSEWQPINLDGLYALTVVGDVLFAKRGGVLHRSMDRGLSFEARPSALGDIRFLQEHDGALVAIFGSSFYESTDNGETFIERGAVPKSDYHSRQLLHLGDGGLLFADGPDIFRSGDGGRTWERAVSALGFLQSSTSVVGETVFVADYAGALSRSTDRANTWTGIPLPFEGDRVVSMVSDGDVLFAAIHHADSFEGAVFYTRDLGQTWRRLDPVDATFTARVTALTLDGDVLYVGTAATGLWAAHLASRLL